LPVNSSGIAGDKTVFSQNQPEVKEQPKKGKNRRGAQIWLRHFRKPLQTVFNTVCSSAWANRTQFPACQSTVLALLVTKQFSAKISPKLESSLKKEKFREELKLGLDIAGSRFKLS
jgi:hypothetical protein